MLATANSVCKRLDSKTEISPAASRAPISISCLDHSRRRAESSAEKSFSGSIPERKIARKSLREGRLPLCPSNGINEGWLATISPRKSDEPQRSEEHTSELQSRPHLVCRL